MKAVPGVRLAAALAVATLTACTSLPRGGYYQDDGPGGPVDPAAVADAVPRHEPPSRGGNRPYTVLGVTYQPLSDARGYRERGIASWYGKKFHGRRTSNGEVYDMYAMTAAHKTLPLPVYVRVRNLQNGRAVVVRVNDRGPFLHDRLIDLSYAAAAKLGILGTGTGIVEVEAIDVRESGVVVQAAAVPPSRPLVELIPPAHADSRPSDVPRLYLQVGAFTEWDNAISLRTRLERAALRPIFIQSVLNGASEERGGERFYRVRVGPFVSVDEADRGAALARELGVGDARIVVE